MGVHRYPAVDSTTVLHEVDDVGVLTLTLNRPERHNAWNRELEAALHDLFEQAAESDEVRAIVLTGAGRSFCPSPMSMATAKRQVYRDWERSMVDARRDARRLVGVLKNASGDFREGVRSFVEKRPATFEPLTEAVAYADYNGSTT